MLRFGASALHNLRFFSTCPAIPFERRAVLKVRCRTRRLRQRRAPRCRRRRCLGPPRRRRSRAAREDRGSTPAGRRRGWPGPGGAIRPGREGLGGRRAGRRPGREGAGSSRTGRRAGRLVGREDSRRVGRWVGRQDSRRAGRWVSRQDSRQAGRWVGHQDSRRAGREGAGSTRSAGRSGGRKTAAGADSPVSGRRARRDMSRRTAAAGGEGRPLATSEVPRAAGPRSSPTRAAARGRAPTAGGGRRDRSDRSWAPPQHAGGACPDRASGASC